LYLLNDKRSKENGKEKRSSSFCPPAPTKEEVLLGEITDLLKK
jgi:large-conductance mechanosensitive channel